MSSSVSEAWPSFVGIAPLPFTTLATSPPFPPTVRDAHAALSPTLGAPARPLAWQAAQVCPYTVLPSAASASGARTHAASAATDAIAFIFCSLCRVKRGRLQRPCQVDRILRARLESAGRRCAFAKIEKGSRGVTVSENARSAARRGASSVRAGAEG